MREAAHMEHTWRLVRIRSLTCKQIYGLTTSQSTFSRHSSRPMTYVGI